MAIATKQNYFKLPNTHSHLSMDWIAHKKLLFTGHTINIKYPVHDLTYFAASEQSVKEESPEKIKPEEDQLEQMIGNVLSEIHM